MKSFTNFLCVMCIFLPTLANAGVFDGGTITGYDLSYCIPLNYGGAQTGDAHISLGFGLGGTYYKEESKFWYGTRKEWDICGGKFAGIKEGTLSGEPSGYNVSVYAGDFYQFSYLPIGGTLLPGKYFTPGLIWIPSIYLGLGLGGEIDAARRIDLVSDGVEFKIVETGPTRYIGLIGPAVNLGAQVRLYLIDFFAAARFNYYLAAPSEFSGQGLTFMAGFGISLVGK